MFVCGWSEQRLHFRGGLSISQQDSKLSTAVVVNTVRAGRNRRENPLQSLLFRRLDSQFKINYIGGDRSFGSWSSDSPEKGETYTTIQNHSENNPFTGNTNSPLCWENKIKTTGQSEVESVTNNRAVNEHCWCCSQSGGGWDSGGTVGVRHIQAGPEDKAQRPDPCLPSELEGRERGKWAGGGNTRGWNQFGF